MRQTIRRLHAELGLTILLSSHLLSEVEQLCSRIAVLNQGRKVFEGTLAGIKGAPSWVRLRVGDFERAVEELRRENLIVNQRDGKFVALAADVDTDRIVRRLVERGMPVYEIARCEQTLEEFYLDLMRADDKEANPSRS
jgi:ABC-2 type transport system ATP-binding protein